MPHDLSPLSGIMTYCCCFVFSGISAETPSLLRLSLVSPRPLSSNSLLFHMAENHSAVNDVIHRIVVAAFTGRHNCKHKYPLLSQRRDKHPTHPNTLQFLLNHNVCPNRKNEGGIWSDDYRKAWYVLHLSSLDLRV